jgi:transcriptional regulator with XRE-family HTH domain
VGLSQRGLAGITGVAQPTIARIERGQEIPRIDTLARLLRACGESIEARPRLGQGVDRSLIRDMLRRTPAERLASLGEEAAFVDTLDRAARRR